MGCQYFDPCDHGADTFTINIPRMTFGRGSLKEAGARAAGLGMTRIALFTGPWLKESSYVAMVVESFKESGLDFSIFSEVATEADDLSVVRGAQFLSEGNFDGVVSVGGGSVIDTAKAAMVYALYPTDDLLDYFAPPLGAGKAIPGQLLPHLACPTTSGTGSECTSVTVLRISALNTKFVLGNPVLLPQEALVDPACCDSLPAKVIASTGFDLLCHALECYTAKAYTQWAKIEDPLKRPLIQGANPWSDIAARRALEIVGEYLNRGVNDPQDREARDQLMFGATLAGMAFGNTGTHLGHALSYGVTHLIEDITTDGYNVKSPFVPHGISVIVSAPAIFNYTAEAAPERHFEAASFLQADSQDADLENSGEVLSKRLIQMMQQTDMPNGLGGVGFGEEHVTNLAASTFRQTRAIANSPRETNLVDIENIYRAAISYT
ncbi:MAG: hydroxyacid-oxoacid transhydrogenase [Gammaproteobacteria bacterium]|jgi:hydroxyacid-oxoacid transhydrogenase